MKKIVLLSVMVSSLVFGANEAMMAKKVEKQKVMMIGQQTSKMLFNTLAPKLKATIKKDGILKAGEFCANEAQNLTKEVNKSLPKGVSVKRVSLKNRNDLNAPSEDETNVLKAFDLLNSSNAILNHLVTENEKSYKFYKPMVINQGVCLKCHGDSETLDKEVSKLFTKKYPHDKAIGFKMGDIRGAIVVEIDKKAIK